MSKSRGKQDSLPRLGEYVRRWSGWVRAKYDGFRALAYIDDGQCQLVSRKGNIYKSFSEL